MTVKEMKEVLKKLPDDAELYGSDGHNWYSLDMPPVKKTVDGIKCVVFYPD